jgi:hypothetical protein
MQGGILPFEVLHLGGLCLEGAAEKVKGVAEPLVLVLEPPVRHARGRREGVLWMVEAKLPLERPQLLLLLCFIIIIRGGLWWIR